MSAIGLFELISITMLITSNTNSSWFEALAFVFKQLPMYKNSDSSDILYLSHYYNYSNTVVLDNKLPVKTIIPTTSLKVNETIWSAPLKAKNVNYIEDTFRVDTSNSNKTDNHAGIVWVDGNNKEYYVFLRQEHISIVGTGLKEISSEISSALGMGMTRENGKEYTLKIAYMNNSKSNTTTIRVFLNDIFAIQLPNAAAASNSDYISKVGMRSFNSMAQFDPVKIGTVSTHQFQDHNNNTIQLVSDKNLNYKYNLTMISDPRYEWIPHYIFHREYGYGMLLTDAKGNFTFLVEDGNLLKWFKTHLAPVDGSPQIQLYYNSTHFIARKIMDAHNFISRSGIFDIRTS